MLITHESPLPLGKEEVMEKEMQQREDLKAKLEACERGRRDLKRALERFVFLHQCKQEALVMPTSAEWIVCVNEAEEVLSSLPNS